MEIVLFILLAGVWALFLIPSFVGTRTKSEVATTEEFAKQSAARLAAVRSLPVDSATVSPANFNAPADSTRADILAKRRRALVALIAVVVVTLVLAIATASLLMLFFNLLADVMLAAYVAVLLQIKQQRRAMAAYRQRTASAPARLVTSEQSEVRVVNG